MTHTVSSSNSPLMVRSPRGRYKPATDEQVIEASRHVIGRLFKRGTKFTSPKTVQTYLRTKLAPLEHEVFAVLFLDAQLRLIEYAELFRGTINQSTVYPREVVKETLRHNAASVILAHNHPSGSVEPSTADKIITARLKEALDLVDVRVLDHIIVAGKKTLSFATKGLL
ncbi:TPA: DNA repair protein RadC [Pseudomonas aeruginosa]|nr:DNA repair protein RadC [Pseudomonas aeruginosa]